MLLLSFLRLLGYPSKMYFLRNMEITLLSTGFIPRNKIKDLIQNIRLNTIDNYLPYTDAKVLKSLRHLGKLDLSELSLVFIIV